MNISVHLRRWSPFRQFWRRARAVQQDTGRNALFQLHEFLHLRRATGLTGHEYFLYELYRRERPREEKVQYLTRMLHERYLAPLGPPQYDALLADKFVFKQYFASLGLPVPRTYGVFHPFHGRTAAGDRLSTGQEFHAWLREFSGPGLVIKPVRGGFGRGVLVFAGAAAGSPPTLAHMNGEHFTGDHLVSLLTFDNPHIHPGYLLEERVEQHPFLAKFNPATLHTTRVVTLRGDDGMLHVVGATLKLGLDRSGVESQVEDHLSASLDVESGELGLAALRDGLKFRQLTHHPVHREPIAGEILPMWPAVKQLALRAAEAARCIRSIGWDIGLTADGPLLIEGNQIWGEEILQIARRRGVWTPQFRALVGAPATL